MSTRILFAAALIYSATAGWAAAGKPNVLLIMSDDLREFGGAYTREVAQTPNLDRLRKRGVTFQRAYAQYPVCNPSRSSLLTGLRCEQTGIVGNQTFFRDTLPTVVTFPQLLRENGWTARAFGKILHSANTGEAQRDHWLDIGKSWDRAETVPPNSPHRNGAFHHLGGGKLPWCEIGMVDGREEEQPDFITASRAIGSIRELSGSGKPWLVAAGFHRPHDPFHAPRKYFELYPKEKLKLYREPMDASPTVPMAIPGGWGPIFAQFSESDRLDYLQAYFAGVSFMDAQVGRLIDAIDQLNLWTNTVVVFMGDHGFHLGERGWWNKTTLFERSCRAPLIVAAPGVKPAEYSQPVEFVDLYPTIADFCGVKAPHALPGRTLRPVMADSSLRHKTGAFTLVMRGAKNFGQTVRTEHFRFTRWSDGVNELYDHRSDPEETRNLVGSPTETRVVAEHEALLKALPPWPKPTGD